MFSEIARALISGAFVCPHTMKAGYDHLCDEDNLERMERYLSQIGMRISTTTERSAFYATSIPESRDERAEAKRVFLTIKNELRPLVQFLTMTTIALGTDMVLAPGFVISKARYVSAINDSPTLRSDMTSLVAALGRAGSDSTTNAMVEKTLRKMTDLGYLHLANREKEQYQVTGKIDYFHEVLAFLIEHEQIPEIAGSERFEGTLL